MARKSKNPQENIKILRDVAGAQKGIAQNHENGF
jgi:hypothetical protein